MAHHLLSPGIPREELGALSYQPHREPYRGTLSECCGRAGKVTDDRVFSPGFRNGGLGFPNSAVPGECPGFLVPRPRCPLHLTTTLCSLCVAIRPDSSTTVAVGEHENEPQTEPQQAENTSRKQDLHSDGNRPTDVAWVGWPVSLRPPLTEKLTAFLGTDGALSPVAQKRELHGKSSSKDVVWKHTSRDLEDEMRRTPEGKGSRARQCWKTLRGTMLHLHNLVYGKATPHSVVQPNGISQNSCGSWGVLPKSQEDEDHSPEEVYEEEVGEGSISPQQPLPSVAWWAQSNRADEAIQSDLGWWQDAKLESPPGSSPEGSRKGTGEKSRPLTLS